jgi:hypothetical protein
MSLALHPGYTSWVPAWEWQVRRATAFIFYLLLFNAAQAQTLSLSPVQQFQKRIASNWKPPAGSQAIDIRIRLLPDGTLATPPIILTRGTGPLFIAARAAAARAILRSAPFDMFKRENYSIWRELELTLDPVTKPLR